MSSYQFFECVSLLSRLALLFLLIQSLAFSLGSTKPNVIFIMADDLGYGDLGCFGGEKISTPNVDQLAREGARFTQFYSGSPVCASGPLRIDDGSACRSRADQEQ